MRECIGLTVLVLALAGCGADDTDTGPDTDTDVAVDPACDGLTWDTVGGPFVRRWCTGCHGPDLDEADRAGAPTGVDFATHQDVLDRLDRFAARALEADPSPMPPSGGPTADELDDVALWIDCGAP